MSSLAKYIATCLGKATPLLLEVLFRSLTFTSKIRATLFKMFSTETFLEGASWKSSLRLFSTVSSVISSPNILQ